jgi:thiamine biosynthesis lipoprotein
VSFPPTGIHRRDILRLNHDLWRLNRVEGELAAPPGVRARAAGRSTDLIRVHRPAMGSYFEIRCGAHVPGAVELLHRALDLIDALEAQVTVYSDDSEISRLNATAHLGPVAVEPGLFALLQRAIELSRLTGGAYDVTSGALSEAWGFVRGPKGVPDAQTLAQARARTGWQRLQLDPEARTVRFELPGMRINLGSIGKGYAIDRAVQVIQNHWFPTSALIHGGQSSVFALGSPPGKFGSRWEIALRNPFCPQTPLGVIRMRNSGLGTSGGAFQQFEAEGRIYGHILDPRTGEPAQGPGSVTVLAPTAAEADALSTAFYLLGPEAARDYVARNPEVGVVIIRAGAGDQSPTVLTFGLKPEDFLSA